MNSIVFLIFRRMRAPLLLLIMVYAIAMLGLVLIPGVDGDGQPWRMDFFHAFYFVSYMATTIGFGEIPYELTPGQRMWVTLCIYMTVIAWLFAIGKILALLQDPAFKKVMVELRFKRSVQHIRGPFYLICGYGDAGSQLVEALVNQGKACVVIDKDPERIHALRIKGLPRYVPGLEESAETPDNLQLAGLSRRNCIGVVALTSDDEANLHIAITAKLLHPGLKVIGRADSQDTADNMASFNTDHIINPYEVFAGRMTMAINSPCLFVLHAWLTGGTRLSERLDPPRGRWVICGYGRFGHALHQRLNELGVESIIIESALDKTGRPEDDTPVVEGWGTEAHTLREAGIEDSVGIIAGTDHDTNNLSILMTAGMLNPDLFMVVRQNRNSNDALFEAVHADLIAKASRTLANRIRNLLDRPTLIEFFRETRKRGDVQARELVARLGGMLGEEPPEVWELTINAERAPALIDSLEAGEIITVGHLCLDNQDRGRPVSTIALQIKRGPKQIFMPNPEAPIEDGDLILFAGLPGNLVRQYATLMDPVTLMYVRTGDTRDPRSFWQRIQKA